MLENNKSFFRRHIGNSVEEQKKMLNALGFKDIKELISKTVPENIHFKDSLTIGEPNSEYEALRKLKNLSKQNKVYSNFLGMGYYGTYIPNVILRNILDNPGWAQGRLEMLLNFQQMIIDFTGMDIANASLLDEGTAAAEAMGMSYRLNTQTSKIVFISDIHKQSMLLKQELNL